MQRLNKFIKFLYAHNFVRYLFVGGTTFMLDISVLILLHGKLQLHLAIATSLAYWLSVVYNFSLNRWWTFSRSERESLRRHAALYGGLLATNYVFTIIFVSIVSNFIYYGFAKALAVMVQVSWTYYLYKNYIFT
jgi:putative flippase GtrA